MLANPKGNIQNKYRILVFTPSRRKEMKGLKIPWDKGYKRHLSEIKDEAWEIRRGFIEVEWTLSDK